MSKLTMRSLTLVFLVFFGLHSIFSQDTDQDGSWTSNSTWGSSDSETAPPTANVTGANVQGTSIRVNHKVYVGSVNSNIDMSFKANGDGKTLNVTDTLIVYGDVLFDANGIDLVISGSMIILGNLTMKNKIDITSTGTLVVTGQFDKSGGNGEYNGTGRVYAGSYTAGGSDFVPGDQNNSDSEQLLSDLETDNTDGSLDDIIEFLNNNGNIPLPITLGSFYGEIKGTSVVLSWKTLSELNFEYFDVQKANASGQFESIGRVNGHGNTSDPRDYQWNDERPFTGINYYRLVSNDFDGYTEIFDPIMVMYRPGQVPGRQIFPNPASPGGDLHLSELSEGEKTIRWYRLSGELLAESSATDQTIAVPESLQPGVYLLVIVENGLETMNRIVLR